MTNLIPTVASSFLPKLFVVARKCSLNKLEANQEITQLTFSTQDSIS